MNLWQVGTSHLILTLWTLHVETSIFCAAWRWFVVRAETCSCGQTYSVRLTVYQFKYGQRAFDTQRLNTNTHTHSHPYIQTDYRAGKMSLCLIHHHAMNKYGVEGTKFHVFLVYQWNVSLINQPLLSTFDVWHCTSCTASWNMQHVVSCTLNLFVAVKKRSKIM
jgi:hypothetical protein